MKGLRIGKRRARANEQAGSPLELALRPALSDGRWTVPDKFNFARDVVEALASDPKRQALTFIDDDGVIEPRTFLEIAEGAACWRAILAEKGVQPKDRVLVLAGSSVHWVEIVLGLMKLGAVIVPCKPGLSAAALEARVSSTDATLVVAEHECEGAIEQMSFAPEVHYIDQGTRRRRSSDVPKEAPTHDTSTRDLAFVFASTGATGAPREIAHTHGGVFAARVQAEHWLDAGRGDVVWSTAESDSPTHAWLTLVGPWSRGAEVVLHRGELDPLERLESIYRLGATILCQSPAEYRALAEFNRLERFRSPRLRRLVSTGDFLEPEIREIFEERWDLTIHDGYGQAETGVFIAGGRENAGVSGAIGHPLPGYDVAIVDDQGNELPAGIEGDLALRGNPPTLFAGYWDAPDETKRAFRGDWYVTGDVALEDDEGRFVFVGRAEDIITSSGRTFGPYGVEHVLRSHDAISESAVVGIRDLQRGGHFVRAFVVPAPRAEGSEQLEAELRRHVADVLPEQQVPREIVFVEALPLVAGKVSRSTLREQPLTGRPLWDLPPTTEAEPPSAVAAPAFAPPAPASPVPAPASPVPAPPAPAPATPEPATRAAPAVAPEPEPPQPTAVEAPPRPTVDESEPVAVVRPEPEPVVEPEPEPVVEPEPEPVAVVEPEPEPQPVAVVEPEPAALVEPKPIAIVEPEPVAAPEPVSAPEPTAGLEPVAEVASEPTPAEPATEPEPEVEPAPARKPEFTIVPPPKPVPEPVPEPEQPEPESLPDFVVVPEPGAEAPPIVEPEPEPEPVLEPLPDYIVDPSRPAPPRVEKVEEPEAVEAPPFPGLVRPAEPKVAPEPSGAEVAGIYFPPVTSFPAPREEDDGDAGVPREPRKSPRRRPPTEAGKPKRKRSLEEPGDDAGDAAWMAGLSNRLSAYSLAEEGDETLEPDDGSNDGSSDGAAG